LGQTGYPLAVAAKLRVQFERASGGDRGEAFIRDASLGGLFIETAKPFENGTLVTLELSSPGGARIVVDARVISVQPTDQGPNLPAGMAVRFLDLPDGAASTLGPMFQASRPPARTFLGVGSTEVEIPKAPSVPKVGVPKPAPAAAAAPAAPAPPAAPASPLKVKTPELAGSPFGVPSPSGPPRQSAPPASAPQRSAPPGFGPPPGFPGAPPHPSAPPLPYASSPPPSFAPAPPAPSFRGAPAPMEAPRRTSPVVWIVIVLVLLAVVGGGIAVVSTLLVGRGAPTKTTP